MAAPPNVLLHGGAYSDDGPVSSIHPEQGGTGAVGGVLRSNSTEGKSFPIASGTTLDFPIDAARGRYLRKVRVHVYAGANTHTPDPVEAMAYLGPVHQPGDCDQRRQRRVHPLASPPR